MVDTANALYHERQSYEMCCQHALNNLFQGVAFTKQSLDASAVQSEWGACAVYLCNFSLQPVA